MAVQHSFDEELPSELIVDTSFIVHALIASPRKETFHKECRQFVARLLDRNVALVYSPLLFLETPQAWLSLLKQLSVQELEQAVASWYGKEASIVPAQLALLDEERRVLLFNRMDTLVRDLLGLFDTYEVRLTKALLDEGRDMAARYKLNSHDALVVALAHRTVPHVAAIDKDFLKVEDWLHVWNNHIPGRRTRAK
ncbi:MAG: type II toxin-antitoxin system VapC family toxin [Dehalococcoidia bacterium]